MKHSTYTHSFKYQIEYSLWKRSTEKECQRENKANTYESCIGNTIDDCGCVVDWIKPNGNFFIVLSGFLGIVEIPKRMMASRLLIVILQMTKIKIKIFSAYFRKHDWVNWIEWNSNFTMFQAACCTSKRIHSTVWHTKYRLRSHGNTTLRVLSMSMWWGTDHGKQPLYKLILLPNSIHVFDHIR